MRRLLKTSVAALALIPCSLIAAAGVWAQDLSTFGVLAGTTVTNTGPSVINGNVGVSPGTAIVGLGTTPSPGVVNGTIHAADGVANQAQADLTTLYGVLAGRPATQTLTNPELGGLTLGAGVYAMGTAELNGTLTLVGDADSIFIFNIESTLTTFSGSSIVLMPGVQGGNVFFRVGSSAVIGGDTSFNGQIVALTAITLVTGADINCGAALARNAAVTLDTNTITVCELVAGTFEDVLDEDDEPTTDNAQAVADALDEFVANGGTLPPGFLILAATLTPAELAAALAQLSGEAGTGVAPAGTEAMDSFLETVLGDRRGPGSRPAPTKDTPSEPGTISVLGYVAKEVPASDGPFAYFDHAPLEIGDPRLWRIWAAGYGGENHTDGDASVGSHDRSTAVYGLAGGIDYLVTPNFVAGLALGGGQTDFGLSDRFGDGGSDMVQAALYGRARFDAAYIAAALAYAWHDVSTDRTVTIAGEDHFEADFSAHSVGGQIEGGYRFGWFTPYAALRGQAFHTPSYDESTASGASTFALGYDEQTSTTLRTELGTRLDWSTVVGDGGWIALYARGAWVHDFWSDSSVTAHFLSLPDVEFSVKGAERSADSLLLAVGSEIGFGNGFALAGTFRTELADNSETYGGTARVSYRW
jgi:outer membrane autotransporter protein